MSATTTQLLQEGRYRIHEELVSDASGNTFDAFDTVRGTQVVVKEIPVRSGKIMTAAQQELVKQSFISQSKILTEINHDTLMNVSDYFTELGRQYLVMEFVDGDDLRTLLERNQSPFSVTDVLNWADQMLDALNYLHLFKPPIIHRNIRPENIKLMPNGRVKLLAFGLNEGIEARSMGDESGKASLRYYPLEQIWDGLDAASQNVISGSYSERSARLLNEPADAQSDIYSLGATMYHLLTGVEPVDALERSIELLDGKADPLAAPADINAAVPAEISDVVMRAVQIKREDRFDSAVFMRQVLRTAQIRVKERKTAGGEAPRPAAANFHNTEAENIRQQLREAEERRIQAEQRSAEVARLLAEKQAAEEEKARAEREMAEARQRLEQQRAADVNTKTETGVSAGKLSEDDLLELLLPTETPDKPEPDSHPQFDAEVSFSNLIPDPDEDDDEPVIEKAPAAAAAADEVMLYEAQAHAEAATMPAASDIHVSTGGMFGSEQANSGSSSKLIFAVAGAVILLVAVVGGWMLMSSGGGTTAPPAVENAAETAAPAQPAETGTGEMAVTPSDSPELTVPAAENSPDTQQALSPAAAEVQQPQAQPARQEAPRPNEARTAAAPRPVRTAPSPAPAKPAKKMTVDDLLAD